MTKMPSIQQVFMLKITPIPKIVLIVGGLLLVSTIGLFFWQMLEIKQLRVQQESQLKKLRDVRQQLQILPHLQEKQAHDHVLVDHYMSQLVEITQLNSALLKIRDQAIQNGVQLKLFQPANQNAEHLYKAFMIQMQLSGNYQQLSQFMLDLSNRWPIVVLDEMTVIVDNNHREQLVLNGLIRLCLVLDDKVSQAKP